jgi:hypothetical protein
MNCITKTQALNNCASDRLKDERGSKEEVSVQKKSAKDTAEIEIREDNPDDEIIDLVDLADEYLETLETTLNLSDVEFDELADTLEEELVGIDARDNIEVDESENETHPDFEKALLELFESSESAAAKLIKEEFHQEESAEKPVDADDHLSDVSMVHNKPRAQVTNEKDGSQNIPEPKKEFPKDLFLNLEVAKEAPNREVGADQDTSVNKKSKVTSDKTNWLDSGRYYPESVQTIDRKIAEYEQKIEKLEVKKKKIKKTYEKLTSILYLEGEELKKAVAIILAKYWSLKLSFMNKEKRAGFNENILIKHNNRIVMAKIKGTHSVYPSHKFIAQVWQDLHYSGLGTRVDGALIVNYDIENKPEARHLPYADEDAEQLDDLILIDTRVFHKLTAAIINGDLSVEEARKILFKKGRVEFK